MPTIIYIDQADSTNSVLAASASHLTHGTTLAAHAQTSGRGQRGNSWEAEPHKNLTFSILIKPSTIPASRQFELSQSIALSITSVLRDVLDTDEIQVKWPNDIYWRNKKICGILIENTISGRNIDHSIVGIGVNVNQEKFVSDAPNPVSMTNITGKTYELEPLLERLVTTIINDFDNYEANPNEASLAARYRMILWRGQGYWPFHDVAGNFDFEARITAIAPTGHLTLADHNGAFRTYAFKEVAAIL